MPWVLFSAARRLQREGRGRGLGEGEEEVRRQGGQQQNAAVNQDGRMEVSSSNIQAQHSPLRLHVKLLLRLLVAAGCAHRGAPGKLVAGPRAVCQGREEWGLKGRD